MKPNRIDAGAFQNPVLEILPTRVRRGYTGGALLEWWEGGELGEDGDRPEDWFGSTTAAVNTGLPEIADEGITRIHRGGGVIALTEVLAANPDYYLGETHQGVRGLELGFLAKLLDSAIRLHVQAHPTSEFAREHLGSRYGKLETYTILAIRDGMKPTLRLGFQRAPSREEWRRIIAEQDIEAMDACFDPIPLRVGEVWRVPGGLPHAIGAGVLMLEVMEPTDLVVRCEFSREGITVPEEGRFMRRGLDFCLDIFDYESRSVEEIRRQCQLSPQILDSGPDFESQELVGASHTDCFGIRRLRCWGKTTLGCVPSIRVLLVSQGRGVLCCGDQKIFLRQSTRLILAAKAPEIVIIPEENSTLEILVCQP